MEKGRILLVQNCQTQGNGTRTLLENAGYDVIFAGSGLWALITSRSAAADLIILDMALPDREGIDLCRRFRSRESTRSVPIILLADRGYRPESIDRQEDRPDDYLARPFTESDLNARISAALGRRTPDKGAEEPNTEQGLVSAPRPSSRPVLRLVPKSAAQAPAGTAQQERTAGDVIDAATGLFSRQQFEAMFSKEFKQHLRFKHQMSCMMIDLDGRKMGRTVDEALLKAIMGLVQGTIREVDTAACWTGGSFIVLLPNTTRDDAVQAAARVLEAVANHPFTWPDATRVTMSIGVAGVPDEHIETEQELIDAAIDACSRALDMMAPVPKPLEDRARAREALAVKAAG